MRRLIKIMEMHRDRSIAVKTPLEGRLDLKPKSMGIYAICLSPRDIDKIARRQSFVTSLWRLVHWRDFCLIQIRFDYLLKSPDNNLLGVGRQDVGVTGVQDGHGGATEELTAGGTKLDL